MVIQMKRYRSRGKPGAMAREAILKRQRGKCFYCGIRLGEFLMHRNKLICATLCWDHLLPFSYTYNNEPQNFVAACRQCNSLKHSKVFDSIGKAIEYVQEKRASKALPVFELPNFIHPKTEVAEVSQQQVSDGLLLETSRRCVHCGATFSAKRGWSRYCNSRCRWNAWAARHPRQLIQT